MTAAEQPAPAIELRAVTHGYRDDRGVRGRHGRRGLHATDNRPADDNDHELRVLSELSLSVAAGEVVALIGPSGCGKSTLLELVCGLQNPDQGVVVSAPAALMPQRDSLLPWLTALDNAAIALRIHGESREQARARARPFFATMGLAGFEDAATVTMSGGMRQRLSFLRTLLAGKPVLCLDEPFGALDALTRLQAQQWLASALRSQEIGVHTVLLVTHDVEEAVLLADRVLVLSPRPGRVIASLEIDASRPRRRSDPALVALRAQALAALGVAP